MSAPPPYEPTRESLAQHPVPDWYHDAKLGIFIHWGLYSVPAWARTDHDLGELIDGEHQLDEATWFTNNAYAEWYQNTYRIDGSPTQRHHAATYGADHDYRQFAGDFRRATAAWEPAEWAALFARVGARYVVLTTKHHDGFALWPSRHPNPHVAGFHSERDLVGELTDAVRGHGMRMALYYSGGVDWSFHPQLIQSVADLRAAIPQSADYVAYADAHWRELIERYRPAILWNDIGYPRDAEVERLFADYYNQMPDGLVNNRFTRHFDMQDGNIVSDTHSDFDTPEYTTFSEIRARKWEATRGIGASFGYNQLEGPEHYLSGEQLVRLLVDVVSKNGNLLLNVGPMADGTIPDLQRAPLEALGSWLSVNGEAVFDTRPWQRAEDTAADGTELRYTTGGGALYVIMLAPPRSPALTVPGLALADGAEATLLGTPPVPLAWARTGAGTTITLPEPLASGACAVRITPAP